MLSPTGMRFSDHWRTPTVIGLATAAGSDRRDRVNLDPDRLSVLADALEDAGCENRWVLESLRNPRVRRWSWVLDLILSPHVPGADLEPYREAICKPTLTSIEFALSRHEFVDDVPLRIFYQEARHLGWDLTTRHNDIELTTDIRLDRPWRWPWYFGGARNGATDSAMTLPLRHAILSVSHEFEMSDYLWDQGGPADAFKTCEYRLHYYAWGHFIGDTRLPVYVAVGTPRPERFPFEMPTRRPSGPQ